MTDTTAKTGRDEMQTARQVIEYRFRGKLTEDQQTMMDVYTEMIWAWHRKEVGVTFEQLIEIQPSAKVRAQMRLYNLGDVAWRAFCEELVRRQDARGQIVLTNSGAFTTAQINEATPGDDPEHRKEFRRDRELPGGRTVLEIAIGVDRHGNTLWPSDNPILTYKNGDRSVRTVPTRPVEATDHFVPDPDPAWDAWTTLGRPEKQLSE